MTDGHRDLDGDEDAALARAFETRHPGLALAWRLIKRRPFSGLITAACFLIVSTIVLEGFGAGNTLFQRWAETNWYAPFESKVRMEAVRKGADAIGHSALHLGEFQKLDRPLAFYAVDGGTNPPDSMTSLDDIKESNDPYVIARAPETLHTGQKIMAFYTIKGDVAQTDGYVLVWDGRIWGLVTLDDYKAASLAMEDSGS